MKVKRDGKIPLEHIYYLFSPGEL